MGGGPGASQMAQWQKKLPASAGDSRGAVSIPWSRKWKLTPMFLPVKFHGQRSLAGYSPWGCRESDMTQHLFPSLLGQRDVQVCEQLNHFLTFFSQTRICSPLLTPKASSLLGHRFPSLPPLRRPARWQDWSACSLHSEDSSGPRLIRLLCCCWRREK